ncbi:transporter substrate-binding domain-containing protein [Ectopseudomonas mendocina]|uniref:Transporter substrate-binding domain-containing protein n=1 Tax=Ectopseudomonas mendocina TaxID=300 RepID=A0ABZ2RDS1_ECTME
MAFACSDLSLAAELRLFTEEYRPLSFTENGELTGMAVEVVEQLLQRADVPGHIELVPWTRGYYQVQKERGLALFPVSRTARREKLFKWVGPIAVSRTGVYTKRDSGLKLRNLDDLDRQGITAVPKQWYTYEYLSDKGLKGLYAVPTPEHVVRMFKYGRISVLVSNDMVLDGLLAEQGMSRHDVELQFHILDSYTYIAFSPDTSPELLKHLQATLSEINRDGTLERIHREWFAKPYLVPPAQP